MRSAPVAPADLPTTVISSEQAGLPWSASRARSGARWFIAMLIVAHGLIHLLGAASAFGWGKPGQLMESVDATHGALWLAGAATSVAAGMLLLRRNRRWWIVGAVAVVVSQVAIVTSWSDAKFATIVNLVLLGACIHGYESQGPHSSRAEYHHRVSEASRGLPRSGSITEDDLNRLPECVAAYVRQSGAVGQPRVVCFGARFHGRIRADPHSAWMPFTGEQFNTYGNDTARTFFMDATRFGLPVDVLHVYADATASMRVKICSLVTMVDADGPVMDRGETVTVFNDMCLFAPAALVDAPIVWDDVDAFHAVGEFTNGSQTVRAELVFNDRHELVDFVSDDRSRASADGKRFTSRHWSTPTAAYQDIGTRRVCTRGTGTWRLPAPDGAFPYLEYNLDQIVYNETSR